MVVDYQVAVPEDLPNPTDTIVGAIKNESTGGTFGEFVVDVENITASGEFCSVMVMKIQLVSA